MVPGKQLADFVCRTLHTSTMLLVVYGAYQCVIQGNRYSERQKHLKQGARNQDPKVPKACCQID